MSRTTQPKGSKGSLKWIQDVVNDNSVLLDDLVNKAAGFKKEREIEWLSPLADENYSEYRDQAFLDLLAISLNKAMCGHDGIFGFFF